MDVDSLDDPRGRPVKRDRNAQDTREHSHDPLVSRGQLGELRMLGLR